MQNTDILWPGYGTCDNEEAMQIWLNHKNDKHKKHKGGVHIENKLFTLYYSYSIHCPNQEKSYTAINLLLYKQQSQDFHERIQLKMNFLYLDILPLYKCKINKLKLQSFPFLQFDEVRMNLFSYELHMTMLKPSCWLEYNPEIIHIWSRDHLQ